MPMKPGKGQKTISENIREFHHGDRFKKAVRKFGKKKANKIAEAAAFSNARRTGNHDPHNAIGSH